MAARMTWALVAGLWVGCSACSSGDDDAPLRIRDTTGAEFTLGEGDAGGLQSVTGLTITCADERLDTFALWPGETGLALVCGMDPRSQRPADYLCRPVACNLPAECPDGFTCQQGLCQASVGGEQVHSLELMARCLHATPRFERCLDAYTDPSWALVSQTLLDSCNTDSLCTIPAACR